MIDCARENWVSELSDTISNRIENGKWIISINAETRQLFVSDRHSDNLPKGPHQFGLIKFDLIGLIAYTHITKIQSAQVIWEQPHGFASKRPALDEFLPRPGCAFKIIIHPGCRANTQANRCCNPHFSHTYPHPLLHTCPFPSPSFQLFY